MPDIFVAPKVEKAKESEKPEKVKEPLTVRVADDIKVEDKSGVEPKGGSLSAFISYPDTVRFDTQASEETIILLLRKHWVTNISWLLLGLLLLFIPTSIFPIMISRGFFSLIPTHFMVAFTLVWYLASCGYILLNFITWYFNVYIVTNERVIDVDFYQLLYKQLSSTRISRVQDLTYKLGGMVRAIFDYGDVFIQTAGTEENFEFEAVPHPGQVVRIIGELTEKREEAL